MSGNQATPPFRPFGLAASAPAMIGSRRPWLPKPLAPGDPRHGTVNGYSNYGCRCDACRLASRENNLRRYEKQHTKPCVKCGRPARDYPGGKGRCRACYDAEREAQHGTESRYNRGCKCVPCKAAAATARRARRAADREAARAYDREYRRRVKQAEA